MTDYELVYFFYDVTDGLQTTFMNFVAVLFAFLIAAYLIADKLDAKIVFVVITLFTLVTMQQVFYAVGFGHDVSALAGQIAARAAEDSSNLGWHGAATHFVGGLIPIFRASVAVVLILSYIGALVFFFHQRHLGRAQ